MTMHSFQTMPQISESVNSAVTSTVSPWSDIEGLFSNTEAKICKSEVSAALPKVTSALPAPSAMVLPSSCY